MVCEEMVCTRLESITQFAAFFVSKLSVIWAKNLHHMQTLK